MALRSNMWSSATLETGLGLAHTASLRLDVDEDTLAMKEELLVPGLLHSGVVSTVQPPGVRVSWVCVIIYIYISNV